MAYSITTEPYRHCQGCHQNFGLGVSIHQDLGLDLACGLPAIPCVDCPVCLNCGLKKDITIKDKTKCPYDIFYKNWKK